jgi:hypothetical protein
MPLSRSFSYKFSKQNLCLPFILSRALGAVPNAAKTFLYVEDFQEKNFVFSLYFHSAN